MKVLIDNFVEMYGKVKLIKTLMKRKSPDEYPELMKWKIQIIYFDDNEWVEICRIDNYLHENKIGSHIHFDGLVKTVELSFEEADKAIRPIAEKILREKHKEDIQIR
jgi:hypothetical protein